MVGNFLLFYLTSLVSTIYYQKPQAFYQSALKSAKIFFRKKKNDKEAKCEQLKSGKNIVKKLNWQHCGNMQVFNIGTTRTYIFQPSCMYLILERLVLTLPPLYFLIQITHFKIRREKEREREVFQRCFRRNSQFQLYLKRRHPVTKKIFLPANFLVKTNCYIDNFVITFYQKQKIITY